MDAIPASQILFAAAALAGEVIAPEQGQFIPDSDTLTRFTARLNTHLPIVWESPAWWPEVTTSEEWRLYDAQYWTETLRMQRNQLVIDPDGSGLYLGLATATAQAGPTPWPPAYLSDSDKWFKLRESYAGTEDWLSTETYERGDLVRYQAADSAGKYSVGYYVASGNPPTGTVPPSPVPALLMPVSLVWTRVDTLSLRYTLPDEAGAVLRVSATEPDGTECPEEFIWDRRGLRVANLRACNWFTYRLKTPLLTGTPWSEDTAYAGGDQVWWMVGQSGDWYDVVTATTAGQTPVTDPLKFERIEIPRRFSQWLTASIAGDWLRWEGDDEKARLRDSDARDAWDLMHQRWERDQKQQRQIRVRR